MYIKNTYILDSWARQERALKGFVLPPAARRVGDGRENPHITPGGFDAWTRRCKPSCFQQMTRDPNWQTKSQSDQNGSKGIPKATNIEPKG